MGRRKPKASRATAHAKWEQENGNKGSTTLSFGDSADDAPKKPKKAPVPPLIDQLKAAVDAGHLQKIMDGTGLSESRINKLIKGTQVLSKMGDRKRQRLKDTLSSISPPEETPAPTGVS